MTYLADFAIDPQTAAHTPRLSVAGSDKTIADIELGEATLAALAQDAPVETVRRYLSPANFANPNAIIQHPDGTRTGIADNRSPWSVALAQ
jgi:gamma-glutamyltranspeptidase/glutathione hydrolase